MTLKIVTADAGQETPAKTNQHPADALAEVRAQIAALKVREDVLRALLIDGECGLIGYQYEAKITTSVSERLDTTRLRKELGDEKLKPYLKESTVTVVRVTEREEPEEEG